MIHHRPHWFFRYSGRRTIEVGYQTFTGAKQCREEEASIPKPLTVWFRKNELFFISNAPSVFHSPCGIFWKERTIGHWSVRTRFIFTSLGGGTLVPRLAHTQPGRCKPSVKRWNKTRVKPRTDLLEGCDGLWKLPCTKNLCFGGKIMKLSNVQTPISLIALFSISLTAERSETVDRNIIFLQPANHT